MKMESLLQLILRIGLALSLIPLIIGGVIGSAAWQEYAILILLFTPLFRNVASALLFIKNRNFLFAFITLATVLMILFA